MKCYLCECELKKAELPGWFMCPKCGAEYSKIIIPGPTSIDRLELVVPNLLPRREEGPR
jgi:Zn finger protein HypA/HybF involved in hydrogenase expression